MNYDDPLVKRNKTKKNKRTTFATVLSLVLNALLSAFKITFGVLTSTVSLLGDGLNNLGDCGSNLVTVIGVKMSSKPADKEHPYGHARGEYVASIFIAFIILLFAVELLSASIEKIVAASPIGNSTPIAVLAVGIGVKLCMFAYNFVLSKKYSSQILKVTAFDSLSDCVSSSAILVSLLVSKAINFNLDGYAGCLVAVFVFVSGVKILKKPISELLGESPSKELTDRIAEKLLSYEGIYGIHDLAVHNYVNKYYASAHAEIDARIDVLTAHEIIDRIEKDFEKNTDVELVIHIDPVILGDEQTDALKAEVLKILEAFDARLDLHDFRKVIKGDKVVLEFDVCVPFEATEPNERIKRDLLSLLSAQFDTDYSFEITVEHAKIR